MRAGLNCVFMVYLKGFSRKMKLDINGFTYNLGYSLNPFLQWDFFYEQMELVLPTEVTKLRSKRTVCVISGQHDRMVISLTCSPMTM